LRELLVNSMGKTSKIKLEDILGKVFGELTIVNEAPDVYSKNGNKRKRVLCTCSCGHTKEYNYNDLKFGHSKSCGCKTAKLMKEGKKHILLASARFKLFQMYKWNAKKRKYDFELTFEQFEKLTTENCNYCGTKPNSIYFNRNKTETCLYNGVDRKDNNIGYILSNCVPCCGTCNWAKKEQSFEDFKDWIKRVYNFISK